MDGLFDLDLVAEAVYAFFLHSLDGMPLLNGSMNGS